MKKTKRILTLLIVMFVMVVQLNFALADENQTVFDHLNYHLTDQIRFVLDGKLISFEKLPELVNGRIFVPLQTMLEAIGFHVQTNTSTQTIQATNEDTTILFTIGSNKAVVNDKEKTLDATIGGTEQTYIIPISFFSDSLGYHLVWVQESNLLLMSKQDIEEWRYGGFEAAAPYREYENLYVNGAKTSKTRYNGINYEDWRYGGFEAAVPNKEYEILYVGGKPTVKTRYNGKNHEDWRYGGFEAAPPNREYEILFVDGKATAKTRYNGKNHVGAVEWRYDGYEAVFPFKEYERKYINGVATAETRYTGNNHTSFLILQDTLIVNKTYSLPEGYNPGESSVAHSAFLVMQKDAKAAGLTIYISSGFRSYSSQASIYKRNVAAYGQSKTDTFSAKPGNSEHQTGLAFDLNTVNDAFATTKECLWIEQNCYKYGFIVRYAKEKQSITGYQYEPWHIRYLGEALATKVFQSGLCLEEYFGIAS
jgi:D-alanyl-D-alanine carboxypeptidase